jgi:hypothetical protein
MQSFATQLEQLINKYFEDTTDTQTRDDFLVELLVLFGSENKENDNG